MEPHGVGRPLCTLLYAAARLPVGLLLFHTRSDWRLESQSGLTCCLNDAIRSNECSCVLLGCGLSGSCPELGLR